MIMRTIIVGVATLLVSGSVSFAAEPAKTMDGPNGKIWTDQNGMALYTYDKDEAGKSNCYEKCATNWPPLKADASAQATGEWTVVDRTDGSKMWAYEGKPVYTFIGDKAAGEVTGDGKGGVWHVSKAE
jgi:predicted lipoprotein with Yx(FWY)xxD motif